MLLDGDPAAGAPVAAMLRDDPSVRLSGRSGPDAAFSLPLPRGGVWLITSSNMARAGFFSDADWISRWASLIFSMPDRQP